MSDIENKLDGADAQSEEVKPDYVSKEDFNKMMASMKRENQELKKMLEGVALASKPKHAPEVEEKLTQNKRIQALEEMIAKRDQEARDLKAFNVATEALAQNNIGNQFIKPALNHLKAENRIKYDEQGSLVFVDKYGEEKDFQSGLSEWTADEGKIFQSAKGVQGSGDRARNSPKMNDDVSKSDYEQALANALNGSLQ